MLSCFYSGFNQALETGKTPTPTGKLEKKRGNQKKWLKERKKIGENGVQMHAYKNCTSGLVVSPTAIPILIITVHR